MNQIPALVKNAQLSTNTQMRYVEQLLLNHKIDWNGFWERRGQMQGRLAVPSLPENYRGTILDMSRRISDSLAPISENEQHRQQMGECFIGLSALLPMQDVGDYGSEIKQSILNNIFEPYPIEHFKRACIDYARTGEWFPRPKDLIERIEKYISEDKSKLTHLDELLKKCC